ncbi:MAG TPA: LysE family translocator [Caulobacteraceae bacterium]|jgi:threonine/homoserine/homoserine lactone efflux protein|nr:LysE family translocator [Caulobacteraceae bacterium]
MNLETALLAYLAAAALLTITPGLDTAMVLRAAAVEGPRRAGLAALGIIAGCLVWGAAVALGLGVLLVASHAAYVALKWAGALYLGWLGINLLLRPRSKFELEAPATRQGNIFLRGLLTNLLNPKVGVFYISFLPQFVPAGMPAAPFMFGLAAIHGLLGIVWFAILIGATTPLRRWLQRQAVVRWLDRVTGVVFLGFGLRLALDRR